MCTELTNIINTANVQKEPKSNLVHFNSNKIFNRNLKSIKLSKLADKSVFKKYKTIIMEMKVPEKNHCEDTNKLKTVLKVKSLQNGNNDKVNNPTAHTHKRRSYQDIMRFVPVNSKIFKERFERR